MERWTRKVAIVTGASAGIGLEIAKTLVRHGMIVVGLSRRVEKMQNEMSKVGGSGKFYARACDVTKENDVIQNFQWIEKNFQTVHVLVNNAGVLKAATIEEIKTEALQRIIDVNVMGLLHCTRQALNLIKKNDHEAHIININSTFGHMVPNLKDLSWNIYPATKYAVTAICESLINELKGSKIRVTSISPGVVKTEIFEVGGIDASILDRPTLYPEDVANSIVYVLSTPQHVEITELSIKPFGQLF